MKDDVKVPLVVGVLGGVAKWIEWVLRRNNDPGEAPPGVAAAPMQEPESRRGVAWWLLG